MRKIIHIDMDAFYVSVEIRDNPQLAGKPVAVGGKSSKRGVLSTCNYIARQFGVSSAMPTSIALQKCPNLIVVPGRMNVYREISQDIRNIFLRYTDLIEPLSLDEAFLDLSDCQLHKGSATLIAREIRHEIFKQTGLTASAGIAPLKFVAKIASDLNKPNGQCTIGPDEMDEFIASLPLKKIPGVGKVTSEKLARLGFVTCADVCQSNETFLVEHLGKYGHVLWRRCHGIDEREVQVSRERKSVGVERTFEQDILEPTQLMHILNDTLLPELCARADKYLKTRVINKVGVKVKFSDFQQTTKEQATNQVDPEIIARLLAEALPRGQGKAVRLLGVHIGLRADNSQGMQLGFEF